MSLRRKMISLGVSLILALSMFNVGVAFADTEEEAVIEDVAYIEGSDTTQEEAMLEEELVLDEETVGQQQEDENAVDVQEEESIDALESQEVAVTQEDTIVEEQLGELQVEPLGSGIGVLGESESASSKIGESISRPENSGPEVSVQAAVDETFIVSGTNKNTYANQVFTQLNTYRKQNGLAALKVDADLQKAAMQRAAEIALYFNHQRPDGTMCFTAHEKIYSENIAMGYGTPTAVMNGWKSSPGHNAAMLGSYYTSVGVGSFTQGGVMYWVQLFGYTAGGAPISKTDTSANHTINMSYSYCGNLGHGFNLNMYPSQYSSVNVGEKLQLTYGIINDGSLDSNGNPMTYCSVNPSSLTWKSSAGKVCSVSKGSVKGIGLGKSTISATLSGKKTVSTVITVKNKPYTISKNYVGGSNGTVTVISSADGSPATLYPYAGATVTFRTSPKTGYTLTRMSYTTASGKTVALKRITGSGKAGTNSVYSFKMPAENVKLNATFSINKQKITKQITGNGKLTIVNNVDGSIGTLYPQVGKTVTFKAVPASGYRLSKINYIPSSTGKPIALTKVPGTTSTYTIIMPNCGVTLNGVFVRA